MPADYKAMYLSLIQAAGNAVTALEHKRTDRAAELLREGLSAAEEIYLQTKDTAEQP